MESGLKVIYVEALDLPDAWYQCLNKVLEFGHEYTVERGSYKGQKRKELDYVVVQVKKPSNRPIVPDIPQGVGLPPPSSLEYVEKYMEYLVTDFKSKGEDYTYGERLTNPKVSLDTFIEGKRISGEIPHGTNQIEKIIEMYKSEGYGTNQAIMEIAMPSDVLLKDPPCLRLIDTRIKDNQLHFAVYFRSWELWAGFPSNLAALQLLKEYMAKEIGVEDGEIIASSKGLHLYDYAWEFAKTRTYRK